MSRLNPDLLVTDTFMESEWDASLYSGEAKGTYNPMQFVIRLREDIHQALKEEELSDAKIQAHSTYLHENIHWWQHVGSFFGFLSSLSYPAIANVARRDLKTLIERGEKYKSIKKYDHILYHQYQKLDNQEVNRILNYWYDIHYAKVFSFNPKNIYKISQDRRFFLSIGHCYHMFWSTSLHTLAACIDPEYTFLPDTRVWDMEFQKIKEAKVEGFYPDSSLSIAPIGIHAIYEGQARFNQLQYLAIAYDNQLTYTDFAQMGMLSGIYVEAFNVFLEITGIQRPDNLNNAVIGLFLLICDIAINPTDGFPNDIMHYESFIYAIDPGIRFVMLCQTISKDKAKWENSVQDYSASEYYSLSEQLCESIVSIPPHYGSAVVNEWIEKQVVVQELLEEERIMKFKPDHISIGLFFSKFLRFQQDKLRYPNIFCWIGKSMTGECCKEIELDEVKRLFDKHRALYIDDVDKEIHPMLFEEFPPENVEESFNAFYTYNTTYDMIVKWIMQEGEFTYDYHWLTPKYSDDVMKNWIRENFKGAFGIYPEELKVI